MDSKSYQLAYRHFAGINVYTPNEIYPNLNYFLYKNYGKSSKNKKEYKKWFGLTGWIYKGLEQLKDYEGVVYRRMTNIQLKKYLALPDESFVQGHETATLLSFTSTTINKEVAKSFSN